MTKDRVLPLPVGAETQMSLGRYPPCPIKYPLDALWRMAGITSACTERTQKQTLTTESTGLNPVHPDKQLYTTNLFSHLCCCCYRHERGRNQNQLLKETLSVFAWLLYTPGSSALNTEISPSMNSATSHAQLGCYSVKCWFQLIPVSLFSR